MLQRLDDGLITSQIQNTHFALFLLSCRILDVLLLVLASRSCLSSSGLLYDYMLGSPQESRCQPGIWHDGMKSGLGLLPITFDCEFYSYLLSCHLRSGGVTLTSRTRQVAFEHDGLTIESRVTNCLHWLSTGRAHLGCCQCSSCFDLLGLHRLASALLQ